ncbi:YkoP family protein [Metabacillus sediminilitoris]|uniref:YkoP-like domain-containing protein n=1 Tax=Metabacillus sediminilitoris TaxID=2567941 RepID=A0A4S4BX71_9BACI|nr:hypothetical protein [Metabacillus sediminilitoris]QGQ46112.1 hypothetical protein GMB29_13320 [Metabacillus sediminilitoris]THF79796.1 hypothetical protein E6W99_12440 [Metabacillus sediminilitoris]
MRSYLLSFWNILDPLYYLFTRLEYLDRHSGIFRVRLTKYKGKEVLLSDGTLIKKNDKLVKIHLHNVKLLSELKGVPCSVRRGRIIFQKVLISMPLIAEYINGHKEKNEIKGVIGITMLYKGAEKIGFEIFQPCHPLYKLFKRISQTPLYLLSAEQPKISKIPDTYYLFISKEKLQQTYNKTKLNK